MKKLLAILGAVGLTATGASSVVACDNHDNKAEKKNDNIKPGPKPTPVNPNPTYSDQDYTRLAQGIIGLNFFDTKDNLSNPPLFKNTSFIMRTKIDFEPTTEQSAAIVKSFGKNFDIIQWITSLEQEYKKLATALHINKTYEEQLKTDVWDFDNITIDTLSNSNKYQFTHKSDVTGIIWNISIKLSRKDSSDGKIYSTDFNSAGDMNFVDIPKKS
ncbi:lipoprotein [Spiroplasma sp. DGKH1]|uniref:lipoprotein n=1 Tax=Spiroplasma sp. DGKH1 TaxID=3050074 RepID=UPI0034C5E084